jgi:HD superfamily phosphodiesterase
MFWADRHKENGSSSESEERRKVVNWEEFIKKLFEIAEPYLAIRGDLLHTQVTHEYALLLMRKEGGDRHIVEPAIILHDVGWSRLDPGEIKVGYGLRAEGEKAARLSRRHELEGAGIARRLLEELGYDPSLIDPIVLIIARHDSGKEPESLEEKLVKDADRLWRLSKIGHYQAMERQNMTSRDRCEFLAKRMGNWFFTTTARELAQKELRERASEIERSKDA